MGTRSLNANRTVAPKNETDSLFASSWASSSKAPLIIDRAAREKGAFGIEDAGGGRREGKEDAWERREESREVRSAQSEGGEREEGGGWHRQCQPTKAPTTAQVPPPPRALKDGITPPQYIVAWREGRRQKIHACLATPDAQKRLLGLIYPSIAADKDSLTGLLSSKTNIPRTVLPHTFLLKAVHILFVAEMRLRTRRCKTVKNGTRSAGKEM